MKKKEKKVRKKMIVVRIMMQNLKRLKAFERKAPRET